MHQNRNRRAASAGGKMKIENIRVNGVNEPIGFQMQQPVISWNISGKISGNPGTGITVTAENGSTVSVSENADPLGTLIPMQLSPRTCYRVKITAEDETGTVTAETFFETGKREENWEGEWISPKNNRSSALVRKTFHLKEVPAKTRLYITGLGLYECRINGTKIDEEYLTPGYHSYDFHIMADTFRVPSELLHEGVNELEVMLGEGWFKGRLGFEGGYTNLYGSRLWTKLELWGDGELLVKSDRGFTEYTSPVTFSNIYDGEVYDAGIRPEAVGEVMAGLPEGCGPLEDRLNLPVAVIEKFPVREILHTKKGSVVLDFGQNLTGFAVFESHLPKGACVTLTAGEILQNGEFYHDNYRTAKSEYRYISDGRVRMVRPHFTFYGFRYMLLEIEDESWIRNITAWHIRSNFTKNADVTTGNPGVNRLIKNAVYGMSDNFLDIPTDCPQRDERLGWTGDAQAISETAMETFYMKAFYRKYLWDMRAEQSILGGAVPNVVPRIKKPMIGEAGSSPWADAGCIIPWNLYRKYGDRELLRETYPGMKAWVDFEKKKEEAEGGPHLIKSGFHFADWLALDRDDPAPFGATDPLYIASAYYYKCVSVTAMAAETLGYPEAGEMKKLAREILTALREKYFQNGICTIETQTAHALAICFGLTEDPKEEGNALNRLVKEKRGHLDTGFVGTPLLLPALTVTGHHDTAVGLFLKEDYPGWLYSVNLGATTIWERWNSVLPDGSMNPEGMNSLNHYTMGSVLHWVYAYLSGVRETEPGFKSIVIEPHPDRRLGSLEAVFNTASGRVESSWKTADENVTYHIRVDGEIRAEVKLPGREPFFISAGTYTYTDPD